MARRARTHTTARQYPRTARLNELIREIVADEIERLDDERLELFTVTAVIVEPDLRRARVLFDTLDGEEGDEETLEALAEHRVRLQAAIGRQARTKRVPELRFAPDTAVRAGEHIDAVLRDIDDPSDEDGDAEPEPDAGAAADEP